MATQTPPTLYYNARTDRWTEEPIEGAPTWQHKSMVGYRGWKAAQANRERHRANLEAWRQRRAQGQREHVLGCLALLLGMTYADGQNIARGES